MVREDAATGAPACAGRFFCVSHRGSQLAALKEFGRHSSPIEARSCTIIKPTRFFPLPKPFSKFWILDVRDSHVRLDPSAREKRWTRAVGGHVGVHTAAPSITLYRPAGTTRPLLKPPFAISAPNSRSVRSHPPGPRNMLRSDNTAERCSGLASRFSGTTRSTTVSRPPRFSAA